jgi:hypothetical protein
VQGEGNKKSETQKRRKRINKKKETNIKGNKRGGTED